MTKKRNGLKGLIQKLDRLYSKVTGRHHQFIILLAYQNKGTQSAPLATRVQSFSMSYRDGDSFYRTVKKHFAPRFIRAIPKHLLRNGNVTIREVSYLGRF